MFQRTPKLFQGVCVAMILIALLGCSRSLLPPPPSLPPSSHLTAGATAEIVGTYATYGQVQDHLAIVVWSDLEAVSASSGTSGESASFKGVHRSDNSRSIRWFAEISGPMAGTIDINEMEFDLAKGRLLLATVVAGAPKVRQLDYKVEQFHEEDLVESLSGWFESEPQLRQFFRSSRPPASQGAAHKEPKASSNAEDV